MNDLPRQQLCKLIATYGRSLCDDPRRCEALLRDFCGGYRREISVLAGALKEGVAADLLASQNSVPHEVLLARLTRRLHNNLALAEDAARWAVESWALALGVISSAEGQTSQPPSPPPSVLPQFHQQSLSPQSVPEPPPSISPPSQPPSVPPQYHQQSLSPQSVPKPPPSRVSRQSQNNSARLDKANKQIRSAYIAGTLTGVIALISGMGWEEAVPIFGLTFGIYKKSRVCAVIMFCDFIRIILITLSDPTTHPVILPIAILGILFAWAYFQCILGTFAYQKIS